MIQNKLLQIINEEIGEFDFLNNDKRLEHEEVTSTLRNKDFQKQFICDSLVPRNDNIKYNIKDSDITGDWDNVADDINKFSINHSIDVQYYYDQTKQPINFILSFYGDNIRIDVGENSEKGDYYNEPQQNRWISYIDWDDINVQLETKDGDDIKFFELNQAPINIQHIFISKYLTELIEDGTNMSIKNVNKNQGSISSYC